MLRKGILMVMRKLLVLLMLVILILTGCTNKSSIQDTTMSFNRSTNSIEEGLDKEKLIEILLLHQNSDDGFGTLPPSAMREPDLYSTYYTTEALKNVGSSAIQGVHRHRTIDWLNTEIDNDIKENTVMFDDIYYAVMSLKNLKQIPRSNKKLCKYLNLHRSSKGFYFDKIKSDDIDYVYPTFQAVLVLNSLDEEITMKTIEWLNNMWLKRESLNILARYQIFKSLQMAGHTPNIEKRDISFATSTIKSAKNLSEIDSALEFIPASNKICKDVGKKLQALQQKNGGFPYVIESKDGDIKGTAIATSILEKINMPLTLETNKLILNKSEKGGFFSFGRSSSLGITTYYTVSIFKMLNEPIPDNIENYIETKYEREDRVNYLFSLVQIAELIKLPLEPNKSRLEQFKQKLYTIKISSWEYLRDTYYILYILQYFNENIPEEVINELKLQLNNMQNIDGSFGIEKSDLLVSYYAIKCYEVLDIEMPKQQATIMWLKKHQDKNGIFYYEGQTNMVLNYLFIDALVYLQSLPDHKDNLIKWIKSCYNEYGVIQMQPGNSSQNDQDPLLSTYCGLYMIEHLMSSKTK